PSAVENDTFWALDDVSFDVQYGERVGIIGRNGAGKSTLVKILSRVIYPTCGEARLRGRLVSLLEVGTGFYGVQRFLDTPVKRYSSGMQMRLAFAVAAHLDPDILILDEVLTVGDLDFQQKGLERVQQLVSEGRTLLFVSHSLDALTSFCD